MMTTQQSLEKQIEQLRRAYEVLDQTLARIEHIEARSGSDIALIASNGRRLAKYLKDHD